jgi:hypothetical protein
VTTDTDDFAAGRNFFTTEDAFCEFDGVWTVFAKYAFSLPTMPTRTAIAVRSRSNPATVAQEQELVDALQAMVLRDIRRRHVPTFHRYRCSSSIHVHIHDIHIQLGSLLGTCKIFCVVAYSRSRSSCFECGVLALHLLSLEHVCIYVCISV